MISLLRKIAAEMRGIVTRGVLSKVDDSTKVQNLQVKGIDGDLIDDAERFGQYGFTSRPFDGAEAIVVNVSASSDIPVVIAIEDRRYRLKGLAEGEVAIYDDQGQKVHLKRDRIEVESPHVVVKSADVEIGESPLVALVNGVVLAKGIDTFTGATYGALGNASTKVKAS